MRAGERQLIGRIFSIIEEFAIRVNYAEDIMQQEVLSFVERIVAQVRPLWTAYASAHWALATTGQEQFQEQMRQRSEESMRLFARPDEWARMRSFYARRGELSDPLLRRQVEVLYRAYAGNQRTPEQISRIAALETDLSARYTTFRSTLGGKAVSENEIKTILHDETDSEIRQEAWEASKQIGPIAAAPLLELVELRNASARALGWRDYYAQALDLQEIDEGELFALLDDLERQTREPFRALKAEIDRELAARFGVPPKALRSWHYSDPFFQDIPNTGVNLDSVFAGQNIEALTVRTFDGLGLDVRDILARSDMYERAGKDQHAFCTHLDRATDDVRVLCNLRQTARWIETSLHEFGHAIYAKYLAADLPYLLRTAAHTNTTEAIAMLMGRLAHDERWLHHVRGLSAAEAGDLAAPGRAAERTKQLVFVRWGLVMAHFERALYAAPRRADLNALWWEYVERFQLVPRPEDRDAPDWATKIHLAIAPAYYHNYIVGELTASQIQHAIGHTVAGGQLVDNPSAGAFLRDGLFALGARYPWNETLERVTGERLSSRYFVIDFVSP
jgi:peptidyl-dipeptidase A